MIAGFLEAAKQELGSHDWFIRTVLGNRSPQEIAAHLARNTELANLDFRRELTAGGTAAVVASTEPLITMMRQLDPQRREAEETFRQSVESVLEDSGATLAHARFSAFGRTVYPDATFTPRLAYGTVKGYPMNGT